MRLDFVPDFRKEWTASAGAMMSEFVWRRKVRCHKGVVEDRGKSCIPFGLASRKAESQGSAFVESQPFEVAQGRLSRKGREKWGTRPKSTACGKQIPHPARRRVRNDKEKELGRLTR